MQNKKYFLLMVVVLFFYNTQSSIADLKERFNENKKIFITAAIGVTALASYLVWYFVSYKNKPEQLLLQIQKKKLSNNTHNLVKYIEKTDKFIEYYKKRYEIDEQLLKTWKNFTAIKSSLSSFLQELKEQDYKQSDVDSFNRFFVSHSKNIEKIGDEILGVIFYKDNQPESSLYLTQGKYVLVDIYKQNIDNSLLYFKGLDLFNAAEQKNIKNVNIFEWEDNEKHEISRYGFYEYTSQLLTPKFESQ